MGVGWGDVSGDWIELDWISTLRVQEKCRAPGRRCEVMAHAAAGRRRTGGGSRGRREPIEHNERVTDELRSICLLCLE